MTSEEAQKLLQERGYFSRWEGRQLIGASNYRPGGVFEGARFMITLVEPGLYETTVTDFHGQRRMFGGKPEDPSVVATLGRDFDMASIVSITLEELDRIMGSLREPGAVDPWSAMQLGQAVPGAPSEIVALSHLFMSEERANEMRVEIDATVLKVAPTIPSMTEQERAEAYPYSKERAYAAPPPSVVVENTETKRPAPVRSKSAVAYGYGAGLPLSYALRKHQDRDFHWAPLDLMEGWPSQLRPVPPYLTLATVRTMDVVLLVSAIRQVLDVTPEWLELIVFSTEPVDGTVQACLLATKTEPSASPKPQWLLDACDVEHTDDVAALVEQWTK